MKKFAILTLAAVTALSCFAQQQTSATIEGQNIVVKYSPPTVKNRALASFHSDADLAFKGFNLPKGDYTAYILADGAQWQLAISKATGAKAATYDPKLDLGRVPLTMGKAAAPAPVCKITLTKAAALAAKIEVAWDASIASTTFHLDRGAADSEW